MTSVCDVYKIGKFHVSGNEAFIFFLEITDFFSIKKTKSVTGTLKMLLFIGHIVPLGTKQVTFIPKRTFKKYKKKHFKVCRSKNYSVHKPKTIL